MKDQSHQKLYFVLICLALAAATAGVYGRAPGFEFTGYDDDLYVTDNAHVRTGLTGAGVRWALTTGHASNWHPVTWLSHMLDCELFGLDAGRHHAINVLLHVLNALVLLAVLRSMTGQPWPSAVVAGLFALHPLHVESVAWVAERKDVLSTLLGLLSMWAYVLYARGGGLRWYVVSALLLAVGLMAKPMLVTFPFVYLLLDYWPLNRLGAMGVAGAVGRRSGPRTGLSANVATHPSTARLLIEKIPMLALSAASCIVTFRVQQAGGAVGSEQVVPFGARLANAFVAYVLYLGKTLWPSELAVFHPHPNMAGGTPWAAWQVVGAAALVAAMTLAALVVGRRRRYAAVGWLWFLGTLVPVIGVVQVGSQAMADRYTYVPLIGVFLIVAWAGADVVAEWGRERRWVGAVAATVAGAALIACTICTWRQTQHWRNSLTLYERALAVTPGSLIMRINLGDELLARGNADQAVKEFQLALAIEPRSVEAHNNLGNVLRVQGKLDEAIGHFRQALRILPDSAESHINLGIALASEGQLDMAVDHFRRALRVEPNHAKAYNNLGNVFILKGDPKQAIACFRHALRLQPDLVEAKDGLARVVRDATGQ